MCQQLELYSQNLDKVLDQSIVDRRSFNRIIFSSQAQLSHEGRMWNTELLDLSLKGALLTRPAHFSIDTINYFVLSFTLEGMPNRISMRGKIRHGDDKHLGFQTESLDIDSATELRRIIELNINDETLLNRDLEALSHKVQS